MIVSHDREFLARTATAILELDLAQQQVTRFGGGYDAYLAEREVARRHAREAFEEYADRRDALGERARTQRNWMETRRPQRPPQGDRQRQDRPQVAGREHREAGGQGPPDRADDRAAGRGGRAAQGMGTADDHRRRAPLGCDRRRARPGASSAGPVHVRPGERADRLGRPGRRSPAPNGSGKSTLLGALLGRVPLDEGRAWLGSGVVVGEIDQARALFTERDGDVVVRAAVPELVTAEIRTLLAKFGLRAAHVDRPAASLSPGERTRAALALLQARGVNLLVLDEPTNHLDLPAIEQLESALDSFHRHGDPGQPRPPVARAPCDPPGAGEWTAVSSPKSAEPRQRVRCGFWCRVWWRVLVRTPAADSGGGLARPLSGIVFHGRHGHHRMDHRADLRAHRRRGRGAADHHVPQREGVPNQVHDDEPSRWCSTRTGPRAR